MCLDALLANHHTAFASVPDRFRGARGSHHSDGLGVDGAAPHVPGRAAGGYLCECDRRHGVCGWHGWMALDDKDHWNMMILYGERDVHLAL